MLVAPGDSVTCVGLRTLAAELERLGARTDQVYLPPSGDRPGGVLPDASWLRHLLDLTAGATAVGITVMAVDRSRAIGISRFLREHGETPLVWGGPQPTLQPGEARQHADHVCVGDGETYLPQLVANLHAGQQDPPTEPARPGHVDLAPLVGLRHTWLLHGGRLARATADGWYAHLRHNAASRDTGTLAYETVTARGCPHACTFCGTTALDRARPGPLYRRRSVDSVIEELIRVRHELPGVSGIGFADDNFLARPVEELREFAARYRAEIGLPFICIGSTATITSERLGLLVDAGLRRIKMGIQSGSDRTNDVLGRAGLGRQLPRALAAIAEHQRRLLPPRFDLLVDMPFEQLSDRMATLEMVAGLPRPFRVEINSLRLMEGTPLCDLARQEGWSTPDPERDFKAIEPTYTNLVLALCRNDRLPRGLVRLLANGTLVRTMSTGWNERALATAWQRIRDARGRARRGGSRSP